MQITNDMLAAANKEFKFVKAVFPDYPKTEYTFKTTLPVVPGDLIVVPASSLFKVAECIETSRFSDYEGAINWVIDVVDFAHISQMQDLEIKVDNLIEEAQVRNAEEERWADLDAELGCEATREIMDLARMEKPDEALPF